MNSIGAAFQPDASGTAPKQIAYLPSLELNDGNHIPLLAFGVGTSQSRSGDGINKKLVELIKKAIDIGFRHLDGAESR